MIQEELFLSTLIQKGLIKEDQARQILLEVKTTNKRAEEILLEKNLVDEKTTAQIKSALFKLPTNFLPKMKLFLKVF